MTKLALVGAMSLSVLASSGRAQPAADVPPVPPPVGETTPIPPPADQPPPQPQQPAPQQPAPQPPAPQPPPQQPAPQQPAPQPPAPQQPAPQAPPQQPAPQQPAPQAPPPQPEQPAPQPPAPDLPSASELLPPRPQAHPAPTPDITPIPMPDLAPATAPTTTPAEPVVTPEPAPEPIAPEMMPEELEPPTVALDPTTTPTTMATTTPATAPAVAEAPPAEPDPVNPALAERLTSMASGLLRSQPPSNALWRYTTALLQAAVRLAPDEPRHLRLLIEAAGRSGDEDLLVKTLEQYRKLVPTDEHAQAQLIDLYVKRMQSADDRTKYLTAIVESPQVQPAVRSFAAMRLAAALAEGMQNDRAGEAVIAALQLNPLNLDALRVRDQQVQQLGQPQDRLASHLALLQSNPAQPAAAIGVARVLADAGLVQRSLEWFRTSLALHNQMGVMPGPDVGVDFASELFISGEAKQALDFINQITASNPDDLNAWLLKLVLARHADNKELVQQTVQRANVALTNRMALLAQAAGNTNATTRPIDFAGEVPLPDPMADIEQIGANKPELLAQYAPVAGGMAWLKIFFEEKPAQAVPFTNAVAKVMGEGSEVAVRLQGWQFLAAGNVDEARVKLSAIAESDPIAALGMIQLAGNDPAALQKAVANARTLLEKYPSRLTGSFIMAELGKRGVKVTPGPSASALENVLAQFPKDWMRILDQPQLFYTVRIEPVAGRVSVPIGEPVLVQVTIYNTSNYALTLGADGVIHPDLWFDAQTRGMQPQFFAAEAFARMGGPMVLMPKSGVASQVVRLDQAQLLAMLERFPTAHFQITASVMTNPTQVGGQVRPGPAGTQVQLSKLMERRGAPIGQLDVRQKLGETLASGTPAEKIRAAETLTKFATLFAGPGAGEEAKAFGAQAAEAVRLTANDQDPTVRAWASYLYAVFTRDQALLTRLLQDPSWIARTLGIVATDFTGKDNQLYEQMARSDDEALVRNLAAAAVEAKIAQNRAAAAAAAGGAQPGGQPATQPATTQPGAVPAGSSTPAPPAVAPVTPGTITSEPAAPALTPAVPGSGANGAPTPPTPPTPPPGAAPSPTNAPPVTQPAR